MTAHGEDWEQMQIAAAGTRGHTAQLHQQLRCARKTDMRPRQHTLRAPLPAAAASLLAGRCAALFNPDCMGLQAKRRTLRVFVPHLVLAQHPAAAARRGVRSSGQSSALFNAVGSQDDRWSQAQGVPELLCSAARAVIGLLMALLRQAKVADAEVAVLEGPALRPAAHQ